MEINGIPPVDSTDKCLKLLQQCHDHDETPTILTFGILDRASLHLHEGLPMVYFDQLQLIGWHLHELKMNAYLEQGDEDEYLLGNMDSEEEEENIGSVDNEKDEYQRREKLATIMNAKGILPKS